MVKCPDGEWVGYILYYKKKKGVGGVINGAYARISSTDNPRQSKGYSPCGIKSLTNCTVIHLVAVHSMVQNWLMRYRIVINSINMGIKESDCFGVRVCANVEYVITTYQYTLYPYQ
jgi:hypothetical protein